MAFWRIDKVLEETGLSKSTVYDLMKKGEFPAAIQLSAKAIGWSDTDVRTWQEDRVKASRPAAP
jgi:prophage regulatory protein